jgi:hypothetical protein
MACLGRRHTYPQILVELHLQVKVHPLVQFAVEVLPLCDKAQPTPRTVVPSRCQVSGSRC